MSSSGSVRPSGLCSIARFDDGNTELAEVFDILRDNGEIVFEGSRSGHSIGRVQGRRSQLAFGTQQAPPISHSLGHGQDSVSKQRKKVKPLRISPTLTTLRCKEVLSWASTESRTRIFGDGLVHSDVPFDGCQFLHVDPWIPHRSASSPKSPELDSKATQKNHSCSSSERRIDETNFEQLVANPLLTHLFI